ncbi:hypothetical protein DPMN_055212 [Dreissena polymorpha]|uniref:Uncharacterized protein n=1 Tax=Dreissena polymorpha TaxID=45954 RepID=A0A9D4CS47_DREPO|nr:hypothetical protein DPMN_055212 [Dreissena polymorpha]
MTAEAVAERGKGTLEEELVLLKQEQTVSEINAELEALKVEDKGKTDKLNVPMQTAEEKVMPYVNTCHDSS